MPSLQSLFNGKVAPDNEMMKNMVVMYNMMMQNVAAGGTPPANIQEIFAKMVGGNEKAKVKGKK